MHTFIYCIIYHLIVTCICTITIPIMSVNWRMLTCLIVVQMYSFYIVICLSFVFIKIYIIFLVIYVVGIITQYRIYLRYSLPTFLVMWTHSPTCLTQSPAFYLQFFCTIWDGGMLVHIYKNKWTGHNPNFNTQLPGW